MSENGAVKALATSPESSGRALSAAEVRQRRLAAVKHGLFAKLSPKDRGQRAYRVGRLVQRAYRELADLDPRDIAVVRSWARAECRAVDCYQRLLLDKENDKLDEQWHRAENLAARRRHDLFLTPRARLEAAKLTTSMRADVDAAETHRELVQMYGKSQEPA